MFSRKHVPLLLIVIMVALLLQACGGAATPAPTQAPAPTAAPKVEPTEAPQAPAPTQAAAAPAAGDKKFSISYIVKMGDNPWFVTEAKGLKEAADAAGMNLTVQDVQLDANLAMNAVDQAIGSGTNGIVIVVPDQKIGPAVLKKAAEAKIPVVTIDDYIYDDAKTQAPFVGFFAPDIGKQVAEKAVEFYKAADWAKDPNAVIRAVSIELPTLSVCQMRTDASTETWLKSLPDFKKEDVLHMPYDGTLKGAADAFPAFITAHPEVTHWVLWSCNDDGVLGAVRSLENAGVKADNIIGVGLGAHMACDEWNKAKPTGFKAAVYINAALHGKKAGEILYDYLANGTPLPENSIVQGVMVDPYSYAGVIEGCEGKDWPAPAAAAPAAGDKKFSISYIVKMGDNPWFVTEAKGLKEAADAAGMNLTVQDVQLDANLAMNAVDQAIGSGTNGIVIVVPDQKIGPAVLKKAAEAKIPVVTIDDYIYDDAKTQAPFVGFFAPDIGKQVAEKAVEFYKAADWAKDPNAVIRAVSIELPTLSVCQMRTDASTETWLKSLPDFKKEDVLHMPYDGTLKGAADAFPAFITAHPEVTHWVLWSCNDDGVLGAVRSLENAGVKADNIIGVGLGAHMACDEWNKAKPTGFKAAVYINAALHGKKAGEILYDYLANGTPLPENSIVQGVMVDPTNYKGVIEGCK